MWFSFSDFRMNAKNSNYPNRMVVLNCDQLALTVAKDHVCGLFKNNHRSVDDFEKADAIVMDIDNMDGALTYQDIVDEFKGIHFFICESKSCNKEKHGVVAYRCHMYFPLRREYTDATAISNLKQKVLNAYSFFDKDAKDAARFIFGVEKPVVKELNKDGYCIDELELTTPEQDAKYKAWQQSQQKQKTFVVNTSNIDDVEVPVKTKSQFDPISSTEMRDMLSYIHLQEHDYTMWNEVGFGLHNNGYDFELFHDWSKSQSGYISREDCLQHWNSYTQDKGITIATVVAYAKQGGWESKAKKYINKLCYTPELHGGCDKYFPEENNLTELGQAQCIVRLYGDRLRYVEGMGCLYFTPTGWQVSKQCFRKCLLDLANKQRVALEQYPPLEDKEKENKFKKLASFASKAASNRFIIGTEQILQTLLDTPIEQINSEHHLINCNGVIVNLENGEKTKISTKNLITKCCAFEPSNKGMDTWLQFLQSVLVNEDGTPNQELIVYMQRVFGSMLLCDDPNKKVYIAYGSGSNGKSTLFNNIFKALGDYGITLDSDMLDAKNNQNRFAYASLFGCRAVLFPELNEGSLLSDKIIKKIASPDNISAERKFQDTFSFTPTHTPFAFCNEKPTITSKTKGTWRRIALIPFNASFNATKENNTFVSNLLYECGEAIIQWLIDGAIWVWNNQYEIPVPEICLQMLDEYEDDQNWVKRFVEDEDIKIGEGDVTNTDLYNKYKAWCEENGNKPATTRGLNSAIMTTYPVVKKVRSNGVRKLINISI